MGLCLLCFITVIQIAHFRKEYLYSFATYNNQFSIEQPEFQLYRHIDFDHDAAKGHIVGEH